MLGNTFKILLLHHHHLHFQIFALCLLAILVFWIKKCLLEFVQLLVARKKNKNNKKVIITKYSSSTN